MSFVEFTWNEGVTLRKCFTSYIPSHALGAEGREFESRRPDHIKSPTYLNIPRFFQFLGSTDRTPLYAQNAAFVIGLTWNLRGKRGPLNYSTYRVCNFMPKMQRAIATRVRDYRSQSVTCKEFVPAVQALP